ncbi:MAG: 50S ribosomal protein L4 [Mariprofundaceae bacterium]
MSEINIVDQNNKPVGKRELSAAIFGLDSDPGFIHRVLVALQAGQRAGTHATKTRSTISGGGKKPWAQKGTGRARTSSTRSIIWRHGAVAHGPQPRSYAKSLNQRERRRALCLALSEHVRAGTLVVVDKFDLPEIKTKSFAAILAALEVEKGLLVLDTDQSEVRLSARNLPNTKVVRDGQMNLQDMLSCDKLVVTTAAIDQLDKRLS